MSLPTMARAVIAMILLATAVFGPCAGCAGSGERDADLTPPGRDLGIEVVSLRRTSAGYLLDLRYRVVDPDLALPLFDHRVKPYLQDERSGARMIVPTPPKVGALRQTVRSGKPVAGRTYFMMFANPGKFIKAGDLVTIVIGDGRLEHLVVQ